jgi:Ca2+-transporting ATPase
MNYGWALSRYGPGPHASSVALVSLAFLLLSHAVSSQSEGMGFPKFNPFLLGSIVLVVALQALALTHPFLQSVLRTVPLAPIDWGVLLLLMVAYFLLDEVSKAWAD